MKLEKENVYNPKAYRRLQREIQEVLNFHDQFIGKTEPKAHPGRRNDRAEHANSVYCEVCTQLLYKGYSSNNCAYHCQKPSGSEKDVLPMRYIN